MQKRIMPTFSHLDRTSLVNKDSWPKKDLLLAGPRQEILSGQDEPILAAWVANHNAGFPSSFLLVDSAI